MKELLDIIFPTLSDELIIVISLIIGLLVTASLIPVSYTHLRAHETRHDLVCRLLLEKKKNKNKKNDIGG